MFERKEFEGNIMVTISDNEVRLWVCNQNGQNIFRFKAIGEVHKGGQDITVFGKKEPPVEKDFTPEDLYNTGLGYPTKKDQNEKI